MVNKPRLYQVLRKHGVVNTKKEALDMAKAGRISVDGRVVPLLSFQLNPKKSEIRIDGKLLGEVVRLRYFMLNKPTGVLSSKKRSMGRQCVMDLLQEEKRLMRSLYPVGRLDYNTSGLLILTNDGDFAHKLLQPGSGMEKEYLVTIDGALSRRDRDRVRKGVIIHGEDGTYTTKPAHLSHVEDLEQGSRFHLILKEGKKRQIRLMMKALGYRVVSLERIRIGKLSLGRLGLGQYREIKKDDVV